MSNKQKSKSKLLIKKMNGSFLTEFAVSIPVVVGITTSFLIVMYLLYSKLVLSFYSHQALLCSLNKNYSVILCKSKLKRKISKSVPFHKGVQVYFYNNQNSSKILIKSVFLRKKIQYGKTIKFTGL